MSQSSAFSGDDEDDAMFDSNSSEEDAFEDDEMEDDEDKGEEPLVEILTPSDIIAAQTTIIEEINSIFQIPPATARLLLQHFNWDRERLLERYYGGGNIEAIFEEAHCVTPAAKAAANAKVDQDAGEVECEICMCDFPAKDMTRIDCGCIFCNDCWREHLKTTILDQGKASVMCPSTTCNKYVDQDAVLKLLQGHEESARVLQKYEAALARQYVAGSKSVKFCPAPGCDNAVRLSAYSTTTPVYVTCQCSPGASEQSHHFCFNCLNSAHDPVRCEMLNIWLKKCEDDSETSNWIAANTKECPKCRSTIEKMGGCNHMTCQNQSCKYDFCWVCLGPWAPHGSSWYNCNRFDKEDSVAARDAESKSRASLERYLFYFNRYANHRQSLKLEAKLRKMVEEKMGLIQRATGISWIEVQFLAKAVDALRDSRTVLMYTYVFAFYLQKNNECEIFESNQKDLENATEDLSGYLERDLETAKLTHEAVTELKQKVLDKSKYCSLRRVVLLDHVKEGVATNRWLYQPKDVAEVMSKLPPLQ
eukprot:m.125895 g.125895  ORF g.125895 m.125895 type:complete len:533 (-) comp17344_c0_seq2:239-1837(-)